MTILDEKTLDEILVYLDNSIKNLAKGVNENLEFQSDFHEVENFLSNQYEIRLQNLLKAKKSSIHHLESGMKNKIILRKKDLINKISKNLQN